MNAKPGDKIIITDSSLVGYLDKEWIVIEDPSRGRCMGPSGQDIVWANPEYGPDWPDPRITIFLYSHQYKIVDDKKSIVDPLSGAKKRMDDNLRHLFG